MSAEAPRNTILVGDVLQRLAELPDECVDCVVTSPPYWGLRDYGTGSWQGGDPDCTHRLNAVTRGDGSEKQRTNAGSLSVEAAGRRFTNGRGEGLDGDGYAGSALRSWTTRTAPDAAPHRARGTNVAQTKHPNGGGYPEGAAHRGGTRSVACPLGCGAVREDSQLGLEPTPQEYVEHMVTVFRELHRVLRPWGTVWLNMGDCYATQPNGNAGMETSTLDGGEQRRRRRRSPRMYAHPHGEDDRTFRDKPFTSIAGGLKPKDLVGMPWRLAFALQDDGWYLRADIIWAKPNPMPESVRDRPTKAHEYVFLLTKSPRYFYDALGAAEPITGGAHARWSGDADTVLAKAEQSKAAAFGGSDAMRPKQNLSATLAFNAEHGGRLQRAAAGYAYPAPNGAVHSPFGQGFTRRSGNTARKPRAGRPDDHLMGHVPWPEPHSLLIRNRRSVWHIATQSFPGAHFATFPEALVRPCIQAGTSERGNCPRCGRPYERLMTTEAVAEPVLSAATLGWRPGCGCATGLRADDLELIQTPTGERAGEDPSRVVGRAGFSRPRGVNEGSRPMTRFEQRAYARQLRAAPERIAMEAEAGAAFAHYLRTDRVGARPVPPDLLDAWIARGWLSRVEPPVVAEGAAATVPGLVLDPFCGSGTTLQVAKQLDRDWLGIELNPEYARMAERRVGRQLRQISLPF